MAPKELVIYLNSDLPLQDWGKRHPEMESLPAITPKLRGALVHHLEKDVCGDERRRLSFLYAVFRVNTSKALSLKQWSALYAWLDPTHDPITHTWNVRKETGWDARRLLYELGQPEATNG